MRKSYTYTEDQIITTVDKNSLIDALRNKAPFIVYTMNDAPEVEATLKDNLDKFIEKFLGTALSIGGGLGTVGIVSNYIYFLPGAGQILAVAAAGAFVTSKVLHKIFDEEIVKYKWFAFPNSYGKLQICFIKKNISMDPKMDVIEYKGHSFHVGSNNKCPFCNAKLNKKSMYTKCSCGKEIVRTLDGKDLRKFISKNK